MGGPNFSSNWGSEQISIGDNSYYLDPKPVHMEGQLTMPPYTTVSEPSIETIIREEVRNGRIILCRAIADIAFFGDMADHARSPAVE